MSTSDNQQSKSDNEFHPIDAGKVISYVELGRSLSEAAETIGRGRSTVNGWLDRGRKANDQNSDIARFAQEYDEAKVRGSHVRLSEDDLVRLLEGSAINGNIRATEVLLKLQREKADAKEPDKEKPKSVTEKLAAKRKKA